MKKGKIIKYDTACSAGSIGSEVFIVPKSKYRREWKKPFKTLPPQIIFMKEEKSKAQFCINADCVVII
jgi:hypothetical protein